VRAQDEWVVQKIPGSGVTLRSGVLWRYCGTTERSGTKGRLTIF
jgi:hypothetical protein